MFNPFFEQPEQKPKPKRKRFTKRKEQLCLDVVNHQLGNYKFTLFESDKERVQKVNWVYRAGEGYITNIGTTSAPVYQSLNSFILDVSPDKRVYIRGNDSCNLTRLNLRISRYQEQNPVAEVTA